jgi:FixJ family two-component response regulator
MPEQPLIAIVDDDEILLQLADHALRSNGFATVQFSSGPEFLAALGSLPAIRMLVLDMQMPEMSGYELQDRLDEMGARIPIVFLSGTVDMPLAAAMFKRGAVDVLCKPLDVPVLLRVVRGTVSAKAA